MYSMTSENLENYSPKAPSGGCLNHLVHMAGKPSAASLALAVVFDEM